MSTASANGRTAWVQCGVQRADTCREIDIKTRNLDGRQSAPGHGAHNHERLFAFHDSIGQRDIRRLMRQIQPTREEPDEGPALVSDVIADRSAQHWILGFQGIQDRAQYRWTLNLQLDLFADVRQSSQMMWKFDSDHGRVWTSTDSTAGRSRTIGAQLSPALAEAYTCPPVVPKYTPHESSESTAIALRNTLT